MLLCCYPKGKVERVRNEIRTNQKAFADRNALSETKMAFWQFLIQYMGMWGWYSKLKLQCVQVSIWKLLKQSPQNYMWSTWGAKVQSVRRQKMVSREQRWATLPAEPFRSVRSLLWARNRQWEVLCRDPFIPSSHYLARLLDPIWQCLYLRCSVSSSS